MVKDLLVEIDELDIIFELLAKGFVDLVGQALTNELKGPYSDHIFQSGGEPLVLVEHVVVPVHKDVALSQEAITNGGVQLLVEGVIWCSLREGNACYFEEVSSLVRKVVLLLYKCKDPFQAGGPLYNLVLLCIVAKFGD